MSLRAHFFLSVILALVVALSALAAVACVQARHSVETEMHKALEAGDSFVDNALLSLPATGKDLYLARLVKSFDDNRHLRVALMKNGQQLAASRIAPPQAVPGWFQKLLEIPPERRFDYAPRLDGRMLMVSTDPRNEISEAWNQFSDGALILSLFSLIIMALVHLAMGRVATPLKRLASGFNAVGGGDYDVSLSLKGPRELIALTQAFNRMAQRLGTLEDANRRLNSQMSTIQEEERSELARDLHDEMGPFLFAMRVDAESIVAMPDAPEPARTRARSIGEAIIHVQQHLRLILSQLRQPGQNEVDLVPAVENLALFWERQHRGIAVALDVEAARQSFGAEMDTVIFRLVQEAFTNAARHGDARHIWVAITVGAESVAVRVEDDGSGLSPGQENDAGLGLKGMRERLAPLGGQLRLEPRRGGGACLTANIPRLRENELEPA